MTHYFGSLSVSAWWQRKHFFSGVLVYCCPLLALAAEPSPSLLDLPFESLLQLHVSVASPFRERVAEAAASVSVLTPSDWQKRSARTVEEALEQVPSLASYPSLGSAHMTAIRGYSTELSVRGIANLLDDVPLNNFSYAASVYDLPFIPLPLLSRIEVIRGPGSALYGSDAFHGVLSLSTQQTIEPHGHVALTAASHDSGSLSAVTSTGDQRMNLQAGMALTQHGQQALPYSYHQPISGVLAEGTHDLQLDDKTAFIHLLLGDKSEAYGAWGLSLYGNDYNGRGFAGAGTQFYPPLGRVIQLPNLNLADDQDVSGQNSQFFMVKLNHERSIGQTMELNIRAYQWQSEQTWLFDFTRYPQTSTLLNGTIVPCKTSPTQTNASPLFCPHSFEQGTADNRRGLEILLKGLNDDSQWAVGSGIDWEGVESAFVHRIGLQGQTYVNGHAPFEGAKRRIGHVFFDARNDFLNGQLSVVYGARWDDYSDVGHATSPRFGLIYQWADDWTSKLLYSHAFRAPSAAERFGSGAGSQQLANLDIKPETIDNVELIFQHQGKTQDTELTIFHSLWRNSIVLTPVTNVLNQYLNAGENHAVGVELSHRYHWRDWQFQASGAYVKSENLQNDMDYSTFPRYSVNLGLGKRLAFDWSLWLNERVLLRQTTTDKLMTQLMADAPNYYRTDLHIERVRPLWRYWLDVRNVFNRDNIIPSLYNADGGIPDEKISALLGVERRW